MIADRRTYAAGKITLLQSHIKRVQASLVRCCIMVQGSNGPDAECSLYYSSGDCAAQAGLLPVAASDAKPCKFLCQVGFRCPHQGCRNAPCKPLVNAAVAIAVAKAVATLRSEILQCYASKAPITKAEMLNCSLWSDYLDKQARHAERWNARLIVIRMHRTNKQTIQLLPHMQGHTLVLVIQSNPTDVIYLNSCQRLTNSCSS